MNHTKNGIEVTIEIKELESKIAPDSGLLSLDQSAAERIDMKTNEAGLWLQTDRPFAEPRSSKSTRHLPPACHHFKSHNP